MAARVEFACGRGELKEAFFVGCLFLCCLRPRRAAGRLPASCGQLQEKDAFVSTSETPSADNAARAKSASLRVGFLGRIMPREKTLSISSRRGCVLAQTRVDAVSGQEAAAFGRRSAAALTLRCGFGAAKREHRRLVISLRPFGSDLAGKVIWVLWWCSRKKPC
jgi:hypothetical protein